MGSGAFLVESCRYLAELLEQAWTREGLPDALKPGGHALGEEPLIYARRLIAQSCLYGVDKNPFAVNLARLSIWLVSLSKDAPFTFIDHALKCGDSLVGMERSEIEAALKGASLQRELQINYIEEVKQQEAKSFALFHADSRSDADDEQKRKALEEWNASTAYLRTVGDLLIAAFFNGKKSKDRAELRQLYLERTLQHTTSQSLQDDLRIPLKKLFDDNNGIKPLHWKLAFPDVFTQKRKGFDVFIGNPPYLGGSRIWPVLGASYPDWIRSIHRNSSGKAVDLIAHFFRRSFELLNSSGSLCFVSTNTIFQGDTRQAGLKQILLLGGKIFFGVSRIPWKGDAAVIACAIGISKKDFHVQPSLNAKPVDGINSFLLPTAVDQDPRPLGQNKGKCFRGADTYGSGFLFSEKTSDFEGSIKELEGILATHPEESACINDFIGGKEITSSPSILPHRKVIDFSGMTLEQAREFPALLSIVENRVKPVRDKLGGYSVAENRKEKWWLFGTQTPALNGEKRKTDKVCAISQTSKYSRFVVIPSHYVFSHKAVVVCGEQPFLNIALLSSSLHEFWCSLNGSTLEDRPVYSTVDCYETFPFPIFTGKREDEAKNACPGSEAIEQIGKKYNDARSKCMKELGEGLTDIYNRYNNPLEDSSSILELRNIQKELDNLVLSCYGLRQADIVFGYSLENFSLEDIEVLPENIKDTVDEKKLFFTNREDAVDFESRLRSQELIKARATLPWRYRWPDDVRDDVLARLLALNAERYAEEVAQGLHSKAKKPAATASDKKRVAQAKAAASASSEQMGLGL